MCKYLVYHLSMEEYEKARIKVCKDFFGDARLNVVRNLKLVYDAYIKNSELNRDKYKILIDFYNKLSSKKEHLINSLYKYKNYDMQGLLYDAIKDIQSFAFEDIKRNCYQPKEDDFDEQLSSKHGIRVYNLHKKPERMLISVTTWHKKYNRDYVEGVSTVMDRSFYNHLQPQRTHRKSYQDYKSLSFVSNDLLKTYRDLSDYVCLVYSSNIPNERLITICSDDAYVKYIGRDCIVSSKKHFYKSADELLSNTRYYNEVAVLRSNSLIESGIDEYELKPIGMLCVKDITPVELSIAKKYDLPIIFSESNYRYVPCPKHNISKDYYSFEA